MPATKKATPTPMFLIREKWLSQLVSLGVNDFFTIPTDHLAKRLREMISRMKKQDKFFKKRTFTVIRENQELKVGQKFKEPVFQCWRIK